jgi:hypothetical protein
MSSLDGLGNKQSGSLSASIGYDSTIGLGETGEYLLDDRHALGVVSDTEEVASSVASVGIGEDFWAPKGS